MRNTLITPAHQLFHCVLREGPRADEFYFQTAQGGIRLQAGCNTPRNAGKRWLNADYVPDKRGYIRPTERETIQGFTEHDISQRCDWFVRMEPNDITGTRGVWVTNPRLSQRDHVFGLEGELVIPENYYADGDRYQLQRHAFAKDDEVVAAAIRCIRGRM